MRTLNAKDKKKRKTREEIKNIERDYIIYLKNKIGCVGSYADFGTKEELINKYGKDNIRKIITY